MNHCYKIKLADITLTYDFFDSDTYQYFVDFIIGRSSEGADLETTKDDMNRWAHLVPFPCSDAYLEQRLMALKLSGYLCRKCACVIHSCAVVWKGYAWLFTASSGTGKTTLYSNWKRLLGDEIQILSGDMPFVVADPTKQVWVYPSPWNGKEGYGSLINAPLGGILYLSKGQENVMKKLKIPEIVGPLYTQFICVSDSEETINCLSRIEERILETVPVWHFINKGDLSSAKVSTSEIENYLRELVI